MEILISFSPLSGVDCVFRFQLIRVSMTAMCLVKVLMCDLGYTVKIISFCNNCVEPHRQYTATTQSRCLP